MVLLSFAVGIRWVRIPSEKYTRRNQPVTHTQPKKRPAAFGAGQSPRAKSMKLSRLWLSIASFPFTCWKTGRRDTLTKAKSVHLSVRRPAGQGNPISLVKSRFNEVTPLFLMRFGPDDRLRPAHEISLRWSFPRLNLRKSLKIQVIKYVAQKLLIGFPRSTRSTRSRRAHETPKT
jgi:hypothetical protein